MLPERLSNDLCSLRPGVDRLVQSAILDVAPDGSIEKTRFADGVIRSAARLTYTQVAAVLEGQSRVRGVPARVVPMLRVAGQLRAALESRRKARGSIDFDLPEPRILLDVEGAMTGITIEPRNEAHRLIEECMLAANEGVAGYLERKGHPCMYRVHDPPDPAKIEILGAFIASLGIGSRFDAGKSLETIQALLDGVEGRPEARVIGLMALRSMKQARYAMENSGHFGLAAPTYCHFTSPIRRYPDLVVHRLLRASRAGRGGSGDAEQLDTVARSASELERNAESAERELLEWKKLAFVRDQVGEEFAGVVTAVVHFGLFIQLNDNLVEGLLRIDRLGDERFEHDESRQELTGARSGRCFRLGQRLTVRIDRVDRVLRRVDFSLVGVAGAKRRPLQTPPTGATRRRTPRRVGRRERAAGRSRSRRG
jgi:ribonuclease R